MVDTKRSTDLQDAGVLSATDLLIIGRSGGFWRGTIDALSALLLSDYLNTGVGVTTTSVTSLSITSVANRTFVIEENRGFVAGMRLRAADANNPTTKWMEGDVVSYVDDVIVIAMDKSLGAGTIANWTIGISGEPATGDVVGPLISVTGNIPTYADTSGHLIDDSGIAVTSLAPKESPTFTGTPIAPTAALGTNTTQVSTTAFVKAAIDVVLNGVSSSFDTLAEIASDLGLKMVKTANLSDVASASTAFGNIKQAATTSATGVVEVADNTEAAAGASTSTVTTPAGVALYAEKIGKITDSRTFSGTTDTLVLADAGKAVRSTGGSAAALTVPPNSSVAYPTETYINLEQYGAGQVTITAGAGVTLRSRNGLKLAGQYAGGTIHKIGTDEWMCFGDLTT